MRLARLREFAWLVPRLAGLLARLAADPNVPASAKASLGVAAAYLASPVDAIPDFIPIVGYLDDLVAVAIILDGILNHVDRELLLKYWPGDPATLDETARAAARVTAWVPRRWKLRVFGR